jgi:predicted RNase H-like HicB family nuclease
VGFRFDKPGKPDLTLNVNLNIELEREDDGRWLAEVMEIPGCLAYGETRDGAVAKAKALALRVMADRLEHGEPVPAGEELFSVA